MRDHLCEGPIEIAGVRADDLDGVVAGLAHGGGRQMRFQPDRQTAIRLIVSVDQIGWRMWLIGDPVHQRGAERRHRLLRDRSEEHTAELQSLMRTSYAVFCLKKNIIIIHQYKKQPS